MTNWTPIQYRDFWDVPRIFLASRGPWTFLFDCPFDEVTEDYPDSYKVYLVPHLTSKDLAGSWDKLHERALRFLCEVKIAEVRFDASRRKQIDATLLDRLTAAEDAVLKAQ